MIEVCDHVGGLAMSDAQLAGDLIDAALVSRVVDQPAASALTADGHTHESTCLNCGARLHGPFCQQCGQAAHVHRTLGAFVHDLLHGVFHFEGRVWHTLPLLVLHPGRLTRRYIDGQRARFVSPLALFLFVVFVMFATIQQTTRDHDVAPTTGKDQTVNSEASIQRQLTQLSAQRSALVAQHGDTDDVDVQIATLRAAASAVQSGTRQANGAPRTVTGIAPIDAGIAKVKENPALAWYKIETHAYKYSWLLIPISVPFVWLLFPFSRRFAMYDHAVFVTYSLCFMTLLFVAVIVAGALGLDSAAALLVFLPPLHMYRQLRGTYACSRLGAAWRTCALLVIAATALTSEAAIIVAESADVPLLHMGK